MNLFLHFINIFLCISFIAYILTFDVAIVLIVSSAAAVAAVSWLQSLAAFDLFSCCLLLCVVVAVVVCFVF